MAKKSKVASIAKRGVGSSKAKTYKKNNKPEGGFEEKVREKVNDLLDNFDLEPEEIKSAKTKISREELGGIDWLSEQVDLLTKRNNVLENTIKKMRGEKEGGELKIKNDVIDFFNEFQYYYHNWSNFQVIPKEFIKKMVKHFPFLEQHKK